MLGAEAVPSQLRAPGRLPAGPRQGRGGGGTRLSVPGAAYFLSRWHQWRGRGTAFRDWTADEVRETWDRPD